MAAILLPNFRNMPAPRWVPEQNATSCPLLTGYWRVIIARKAAARARKVESGVLQRSFIARAAARDSPKSAMARPTKERKLQVLADIVVLHANRWSGYRRIAASQQTR
ncbi:MAG: hypothetical protein KDJ90_14120 [Nitratireductor sp.]|nr:hypothetical protein [Nitratireductor sp.]